MLLAAKEEYETPWYTCSHCHLIWEKVADFGLLNISGIESGLLTAAGLSDKSLVHLLDEDKVEAINGLIKNFLEPAGKKFVEELVFRFLLTRGDTLGGSMRNIGGALAQRKLTRAIISALMIAGTRYSMTKSSK